VSISLVNQVLQLRDPNLRDARQVTLITLANYADEEGFCWPSIPTLAAIARRSIKQQKRIMRWLSDAGRIKVITSGCGRGHRTRYQVTLKGDMANSQGVVKGDTIMSSFSHLEQEQASPKRGHNGVPFQPTKGDIGSHACVDPSIKPIGIGRDLPPSLPSASAREPMAETAPITSNEIPADQAAAKALLIAAKVSDHNVAKLAADYPLATISAQVEQYQVDLAGGQDIGPGVLVWRIKSGYVPPAKGDAEKPSYSQEAFLAAEAKRARPQGVYSVAEGVRADEAKRAAPAAVAPAVTVTAPAPSKEFQGSERNVEKPGDVPSPMDVPPLGDDLQSVWAQTQDDFLNQNPQAADWLKGSVLEATDELAEGKPLFLIVVAGRAQVDWLNAHLHAFRRSLSVSFKHPVAVKVVTVAAIPVDAFTRKVEAVP
jgi:hypothetical protein